MISSIDKCVVAFNQVLADFVRDVNKADAGLKAENRKVYSTISMYSHDEIKLFLERVSLTEPAPEGGNLTGFKILSTGDFDALCQATNDTTGVKRFALTLCALGKAYEVLTLDSTPGEALNLVDTDLLLGVLTLIRDPETIDKARESIDEFQDPVKSWLVELVESYRAPIEDDTSGKFDHSALENTMIGSIAKEVVSELDMSEMPNDIKSIDDVFKAMGNSGQGGNNLIGNIVSKVGSKLQDKMANGGLKQQDLLKEAFSMFGPLMGDVMKNMPNNSAKRQTTTKERLQKKLAERGSV
jgi:hypothetical protein